MQTPRLRVTDSAQPDGSGTFFELDAEIMTADIENLMIPVGGFSVQQSIQTPVILGMSHQDLRQVRAN